MLSAVLPSGQVPARYETPPLKEAIFELFVKNHPGWSELSYTRLDGQFGTMYDGPRDEVAQHGFKVQFGPRGQISQGLESLQGPVRVRRWNADKSRLVQFAPNMCAFNALAPSYTTFDDYVEPMRALYDAFLGEASATEVDWVGQRYINRIVLPKGETEPAKFFHFYPTLPAPASHRPFALQVVLESFPRGQVTLNLTFSGEEDEVPIYFLDIYARSTEPVALAGIEIVRWQETAHSVIRRAFDAALTPESRKLFGAMK